MPKLFPLLLLAATFLSGCETAVNLPEPAHTPRIALRYLLSTEAPGQQSASMLTFNQLYVSNSQRMFDTRPLEGRPDATVELLDATGTVVERFRQARNQGGQTYPQPSSQPGYYEATMNFAGQPGHTYTLRGRLPGFEAVESQLTMPLPPRIARATYVSRAPTDYGQQRGRLTLTLHDEAATADYYVVVGTVYDTRDNIYGTLLSDDTDNTEFGSVGETFTLSTLYNGYYNSLAPYPDSNVNGQQINLSTDVVISGAYGGLNPPVPAYLELMVLNLTADAYKFYQSRQRYEDTQDNPFAEPAPLYSNIRNGYGVFGGMAAATYRIQL
ncbi:DUF4249 domain-containing protein [Hymenobacter sp. HSC-4F20]|uniref:DUF4249 domain-containing protein n=1 Tax=Hymenobacter sp. HSC-4F20 TaxID=2864135 RepID=UPI001C731346|nr:DUF4249 domain-containing protein [Hymenobacter sp. HSC-4F20]MBX0292277.1 DUF4249 domain-containing protein [Hymenobacter sp. HSC-4F20]